MAGKGMMSRRDFLAAGTSFTLASLFGLNKIAFACKEFDAGKARIALIIDDMGASRSLTRKFLDIGVPITFSILPQLTWSQEVAYEIHSRNQEIMLHQPMEPYNSHLDPGPGALYVSYESEKIASIMKENIANMPFAIGVNNHMGSRFTASERGMIEVLKTVKRSGFFFVDSLTTSRSKAYTTAKALNISTASRNIFLDNRPNESAIMGQLKKLERSALRFGHAIGIGHPFTETARAIETFTKSLDKTRSSLVHVTKVLEPAQV